MDSLVNRFIKYVKIDTMSDSTIRTMPSTGGQIKLGEMLKNEMIIMGLDNVYQDSNGYVYGTLPSNIDVETPTVGFISHLDTAEDLTAINVEPRIIKYSGGDIVLNENYSIKESDFPFLKDLVGEELITTSGDTLLGADDKAGIAAIVTAMEYFLENPDVKHGTIKIAFTPDEEIGNGAEEFDVDNFSDFAYTVDGGPLGELQYENFNAAWANIEIIGKNVHPGTAKEIMINSMNVAVELINKLPANERPENTEKYEGFFMLQNLEGSVEKTTLKFIIRDHSMEKFNEKKELLQKSVDEINEKYGNIATIVTGDSYYNMKEIIEKNYHIVELAEKSMKDIGIEPIIEPIRGGTDGARLSFMGLPCPNIFTGGYNFHGRYEFIPISSMVASMNTIISICKNIAKESCNDWT